MSIQIEEYVRQTYKKRFKDKPVLLLSTSNGARGAMTVLAYVESVLPRWGGKVAGAYSLPNFKENFSVEFSSYLTYLVYNTNTRGMNLSRSIYPDTDKPILMLALYPELH